MHYTFVMNGNLLSSTDAPVYTVRPHALRTVGDTSKGIRVGFIGSDKVLIIYLSTYLLVSDEKKPS
jgi:hypothetical protein